MQTDIESGAGPTVTEAATGAPSFRDITEEFLQQSRCLRVGELIQHPRFTLLEAVGALEIMDPKMDSGLIEEISFDVNAPRLPAEIIGIMDQILSHEVAWHTGGALSQTLFTSLYLDKLLSLTPHTVAEAVFDRSAMGKDDFGSEAGLIHKVLRAFCLAVGKCCNIVIDRIRDENCRDTPRLQDPYFIIEEEDIVCQTYSVSLFEYIPTEDIVKELDDSLRWLESNKDAWEADIYTALVARLAFKRHFLMAIAIDPDKYLDEGTPEDSLNGCIMQLGLIQSTRSQATPFPEAFNTAIQRKLASTVPPRPMINVEFDEAMKRWTRIVEDGKNILTLVTLTSGINLMNFLSRFSARNPQPTAFLRSLCRSVLFIKGKIVGKYSVADMIADDIKETIFPDPLIFDPRNQAIENPQHDGFMIRERVEWFITRASPSFLQLCTDFLQNRSRMRRNLCHAIHDWDVFQLEAERTDEEIADLIKEDGLPMGDTVQFAFPLSSWAYLIKLRMMELICLLGFELEVYQPFEFGGMFWASTVYSRTRIGHLERIREFTSMQMVPEEEVIDSKTWENNRIKSLGLINYYMLESSALQELCHTLSMLYCVLSQLDLIKLPPHPYSSDQLRYELRMKPFYGIVCPEVFPFDQVPPEHFNQFHHREAVGDKLVLWARQLLEEAADSAKSARKNYEILMKLDSNISRTVLCADEHKTDLKSCLRSCIGVGVAIAMLNNAINSGTHENLSVTIDRERYHPYFPVPVMAPKEK